MQVTPGAMHVPPGAAPGATPGATPSATHVTIPAMFPLPARPVRQARQLFVVANLFAISVFAALCYDLGAAGGAWTVTALDAMVDGGTVTVTLARRGSDLELVVADDGPGMAPEVQAHIFEPFFTTKAPGEGMGLGLAVAHSVVTAHRGQITVDTQPGRGTRGTIRLPG